MQNVMLLDRDENLLELEEKEKINFLKYLLENLGMPVDNIFDSEELSVESKIKLRSLLYKYKIYVENTGDSMSVYVESEKIGEWFKPVYKLKQDMTQQDPRKRVYLEAITNYWSVFENN